MKIGVHKEDVSKFIILLRTPGLTRLPDCTRKKYVPVTGTVSLNWYHTPYIITFWNYLSSLLRFWNIKGVIAFSTVLKRGQRWKRLEWKVFWTPESRYLFKTTRHYLDWEKLQVRLCFGSEWFINNLNCKEILQASIFIFLCLYKKQYN